MLAELISQVVCDSMRFLVYFLLYMIWFALLYRGMGIEFDQSESTFDEWYFRFLLVNFRNSIGDLQFPDTSYWNDLKIP